MQALGSQNRERCGQWEDAGVERCIIRSPTGAELLRLAELEEAADRRYLDTGHPELATTNGIDVATARRLAAADRLAVAVTSTDELAGFVAWCIEDDPTYLGISQVSVAPEHGGRGVGTALMHHAIAAARAGGFCAVVLNTQLDVEWNAPWYERLGFAVVPPERWTGWMQACADEQEADGISWTTRCWMELPLDPTPQR